MHLQLFPVAPFRLDLTVWTLRRLPINAMDRWEGQRYQRALVLDMHPIQVTVTQTAPSPMPVLDIAVHGPHVSRHDEAAIRALLEKMLGLTIDLTGFYQLAAADPRLSVLVGRFLGVKPPRLPSVFEALVNGIACQQLSLTVGITLLNRLCAAYGLAVARSSTPFHGRTICAAPRWRICARWGTAPARQRISSGWHKPSSRENWTWRR